MSIAFKVMLFKSVSHALSAEKLLKTSGRPFKVIPVPKEISSDCGICIRFLPEDEVSIVAILGSSVEFERIIAL